MSEGRKHPKASSSSYASGSRSHGSLLDHHAASSSSSASSLKTAAAGPSSGHRTSSNHKKKKAKKKGSRLVITPRSASAGSVWAEEGGHGHGQQQHSKHRQLATSMVSPRPLVTPGRRKSALSSSMQQVTPRDGLRRKANAAAFLPSIDEGDLSSSTFALKTMFPAVKTDAIQEVLKSTDMDITLASEKLHQIQSLLEKFGSPSIVRRAGSSSQSGSSTPTRSSKKAHKKSHGPRSGDKQPMDESQKLKVSELKSLFPDISERSLVKMLRLNEWNMKTAMKTAAAHQKQRHASPRYSKPPVEGDPMAFLSNLFPGIPLEMLQQYLSDAGGDVPKATSVLCEVVARERERVKMAQAAARKLRMEQARAEQEKKLASKVRTTVSTDMDSLNDLLSSGKRSKREVVQFLRERIARNASLRRKQKLSTMLKEKKMPIVVRTETLKDPDPAAQASAISALAKIFSDVEEADLVSALVKSNWDLRVAAADLHHAQQKQTEAQRKSSARHLRSVFSRVPPEAVKLVVYKHNGDESRCIQDLMVIMQQIQDSTVDTDSIRQESAKALEGLKRKERRAHKRRVDKALAGHPGEASAGRRSRKSAKASSLSKSSVSVPRTSGRSHPSKTPRKSRKKLSSTPSKSRKPKPVSSSKGRLHAASTSDLLSMVNGFDDDDDGDAFDSSSEETPKEEEEEEEDPITDAIDRVNQEMVVEKQQGDKLVLDELYSTLRGARGEQAAQLLAKLEDMFGGDS